MDTMFAMLMSANLAFSVIALAIIVIVALAAIAVKRPWFATGITGLLCLVAGTGLLMSFLSAGVSHYQVSRPPQTDAICADLDGKLAKMEIHELMDQADAPRIVLAPEPRSAPEALVVAAMSIVEATDAGEASAANSAEPSSQAEPDSASRRNTEKQDGKLGVEEAADSNGHETSDKVAETPPAAAGESNTAKDASRPKEPAAAVAKKSVSTPRPAWVDDPPKRVQDTWRDVLVTDEFATKEECDREADRLLQQALIVHLRALTGSDDYGAQAGHPPAEVRDQGGRLVSEEGSSTAEQLVAMGITIEFIRREIARDEYLETVERSFGPMKKLYTLVEYTPAVDRELRRRLENFRRQERFAMVGVGAASVLGAVGLAWGLLRVDTATKGYYSKRLFLGVPAAIIGTLLLFLL